MAHHIEGSRNSCALHGALQVIEAIEGAVPVIHSTAGCGAQHFLGVNRLNAGSDSFGGPPVASGAGTARLAGTTPPLPGGCRASRDPISDSEIRRALGNTGVCAPGAEPYVELSRERSRVFVGVESI